MEHNKTYICFFNSHKPWGGGEKWHSEIASYLFSKNHNVIVCGNPHGALLQSIDSTIPQYTITLRNLSFLNPFKYVACYRMFKKYRVKTVILCLPIDVKVAGIAAKLAGVQNIVYRRGCAIPIKNSFTNRFLFSHIITHFIANSEATKQSITAYNSNLFPLNKITVLYNGIPQCNIDKKYETTNKSITIGTAGRLEPQKNMNAVLTIAKEVLKYTTNFVIRIAGDGSLYQTLKQAIQDKRLQSHIELVGFQNNINDFYATLDIFILTSHGEGFGYVMAEAMRYSIPVIAYNVSSSQELITDNYNGFLIPKDNTIQFAQKIVYLIENEQERQKMGANAREFVQSHFDAQNIFEKTEAFITQL